MASLRDAKLRREAAAAEQPILQHYFKRIDRLANQIPDADKLHLVHLAVQLIQLAENARSFGDLVYGPLIKAILDIEMPNPNVDNMLKYWLFKSVAEPGWTKKLEPLFLAFLGKDARLSVAAIRAIFIEMSEKVPHVPSDFIAKMRAQLKKIRWQGFGPDAQARRMEVHLARNIIYDLLKLKKEPESPPEADDVEVGPPASEDATPTMRGRDEGYRSVSAIFSSLLDWSAEPASDLRYLQENNRRVEFYFKSEFDWTISMFWVGSKASPDVIQCVEGLLTIIVDDTPYSYSDETGGSIETPTMKIENHDIVIHVKPNVYEGFRKHGMVSFPFVYQNVERSVLFRADLPPVSTSARPGNAASAAPAPSLKSRARGHGSRHRAFKTQA